MFRNETVKHRRRWKDDIKMDSHNVRIVCVCVCVRVWTALKSERVPQDRVFWQALVNVIIYIWIP